MKQSSFTDTLLFTCKISFPKYPPHYFPVYLIVKFLQDFDFKFNTRKLHFQVRSIPNRYYEEVLCRNHEIKSDHTLFINQKVFDYYIYQKDVNFLNVMLSDATKKGKQMSSAEKIVKSMLDSNRENKSLTIYQVFPLDNIPINKILMKENAYWNFLDKFKLSADHEIFVNMSMLEKNQKLPAIATKANIFLVNSPYDVPTSFIDDIFKEYFSKPRLLYRNHTYRIDLTEEVLGNFIFCENFSIITKLKKIYFKCVHLESKLSLFDNCAVVLYNLTSLHQTTTINYQVPVQQLDNHFISNYPYGLRSAFESLKSAILPFVTADQATKDLLKSRKIFPVIQLLGARGSGKRKILQAVADSLGMHVHYGECCEIVTSLASQTEQKILYTLHRATNCQPIILCFNDFEFFGKNNEGHEDERVINFLKLELSKVFDKCNFDNPIIIVAMVNSNHPLKSQKLNELFLETIAIKPLEKIERYQSLLWYHQREKFDRLCYAVKCNKIQNYICNKYLKMSKQDMNVLHLMAEQTQGFVLGDLRVLYERSVQDPSEENLLNFNLDGKEFQKQLVIIKKCFSTSLGTPEIPKVLWEDIGGLANLKKEIQNSIGLPLKYSHLMAGKNMKRSGILLFGPPGTGKTLIAKAVATECNLSFISVQGPELLNMYVGQSEQNVREVFAKARGCAPSVIFLDELDSLAPNRGVAGDSGGVMDRVVSQLLSEMDGTDDDPRKPVFVLGATNRPDLIDKQLLRPGRFDKMLYVGPCITVDDKELVIKALTKKFNLKKDASTRKIAELIKYDVTGADLYSICSTAWLIAVRKFIHKHDEKEISENEMSADKIFVGVDDFKKSMEKFVSSLNQVVDMEYFKKLEARFS